MLENNEIKIINCKYGERKDIIDFLVNITSNEFGFTHWKDYYQRKLVEKYKKCNNIFLIAINKENEIVGTCGGLQQSKDTIKFNCFYVNSKYRNIGIGNKLYNLFLQFVQKEKYQEIILCTFKEYDIAKKFYEKRGFKLFEKIDEELWYKKEV